MVHFCQFVSEGSLTSASFGQSMTCQLPFVPGTQAVLFKQQLSLAEIGVGGGVGLHQSPEAHLHCGTGPGSAEPGSHLVAHCIVAEVHTGTPLAPRTPPALT